MIESLIVDTLTSDTTLISYLSDTFAAPSIFSELAPQGAEYPYLVIRLERKENAFDKVMQIFTLYVDIYDELAPTRVVGRQIAECIEFDLDNKLLAHERYNTVRILFDSENIIYETDPRAMHYILGFNIRATRSKWAENL